MEAFDDLRLAYVLVVICLVQELYGEVSTCKYACHVTSLWNLVMT